jgi:sodium-dependent dicarboxylate transporter 2/3/5
MNEIIADLIAYMKSRKRLLQRWAVILLAVLALFTLLRIPLPEVRSGAGDTVPLSQDGRTSIAILVLCLVLWTTEAIPFSITGLAVFLLFPAFGVASPAEVAGSGLGHPLLLFFLSLFLLSSAFVQVGLSHRVSRWVLLRSRGQASRLILFTLAAGSLLTLGITALATAPVLLSVAIEILERTHHSSRRSNFGRALVIASSWGPLIGSVGTPAGAGSNPLAIGYLRDLAGVEVTFAQWMILGVPTVLFLVPAAWLILRWAFRCQENVLLSETELAALEAEGHAPLSRKEKAFLVVFAVTLILWIATPSIERLSGGHLTLSLQGIGLAAALVLFLPGLDLLSWSAAERDTPWGALLVLAAGLAAGVVLYRSGAARWLAWMLMGPLGNVAAVPRVFVIIATISLLRLVFTSSTAAAAILIPLVIALAQDLGVDPWLFAAPAAFASSIGFILPVQAGVHLVSYSAGHFSGRDMAKVGVIFTVVAVVVMSAVILVLGRLTGLYRF